MDSGSSNALNRITFTFKQNQTFQVLNYREVSNLGNTLVQTYFVNQLDFGFKNVIDPVLFDDFAVFKVANETQIIV